MGYVVQYPNSVTNKTDQYRIVHYDDWAKYANGAVPFLPVSGSFGSLAEAEELKDRMNRGDND